MKNFSGVMMKFSQPKFFEDIILDFKTIRRLHEPFIDTQLKILYIGLFIQAFGKRPCSPHLIEALIAGEDNRYLHHIGFDVLSILRATFVYLTRKRIQGASTIEQQLVRTLLKDYRRSIKRKLREIWLAAITSFLYSKQEIAVTYLYNAYYGWKMNGIEQAAVRLGFEIGTATESQAASLIARLKYPEPKEQSESRDVQIDNRTKYILRLLTKKKGNQHREYNEQR
jgi:penicillin-binding protein 1A